MTMRVALVTPLSGYGRAGTIALRLSAQWSGVTLAVRGCCLAAPNSTQALRRNHAGVELGA